MPHLRLIDWHSDNHRFMKKFIQSLKQGGPQFIFKQMSLDIFSRFIHRQLWSPKDKVVFVPAPSSTNNYKDHSYLLAKYLSFYFGGELRRLLYKSHKMLPQKSQTKRNRSNIQLIKQGHVKTTEIIVFVDDILTTGFTAYSAYQALNKPKHFFIFTLIWKALHVPQESLSI